jgi:hypothetical protein
MLFGLAPVSLVHTFLAFSRKFSISLIFSDISPMSRVAELLCLNFSEGVFNSEEEKSSSLINFLISCCLPAITKMNSTHPGHGHQL